MAYLPKCQIARQIPALSRCQVKSISQNGSMVPMYKHCSPISSLAGNVPRSPFQHVQKLTNQLALSKIQIRSSSSGDHVRLWQMERIASAAFVPLLPACILLNSPIIDTALAVLTVMHTHWGLEAIIVDYVRPAVVGPIAPKVAFAALYLLSVVTLAGLMTLIYNGPGIGGAVKKLWAIGK